jgi:hypothetical protein
MSVIPLRRGRLRTPYVSVIDAHKPKQFLEQLVVEISEGGGFLALHRSSWLLPENARRYGPRFRCSS